MFDKLDKSYRENLKIRQHNEAIYRKQCKERLQNVVETKIKTTFIGAISSIENHLGHLWGHGLPANELTEKQLEYRRKWNNLREEILNKGNLQSRNALAELHWYDVIRKKIQTNFIVKGPENE